MISGLLLAAAAALALYIVAGYPLSLVLFPGRPGPPVRKDPQFRTSVSVILAVYNGEAFIRRKLEALLALNYPRRLVQILVVSDGSTDATDRIVESFAGRGVELVRVPHAGKASALNEAMAHASGEILFFTDVRQKFHPDALAHLVANFADPSVGAVSGELRIPNPGFAGEQADMEAYWKYELWVRRLHSRIDSMFSATGCIYAIRRVLAAPIAPETLADDVMIPLGAFFRGYRVILDPEAVAFDYPTAEGKEFRRKLRTLAGIWQAHAWRPELFTRRNRMRRHFLSHRFARLALPWALLVLCGANLALPAGPQRSALLIVQGVTVALALLDLLIPKGSPLKRISSPARTFLAMNVAALAATLVFVVPPALFWRTTHVHIRHSGQVPEKGIAADSRR